MNEYEWLQELKPGSAVIVNIRRPGDYIDHTEKIVSYVTKNHILVKMDSGVIRFRIKNGMEFGTMARFYARWITRVVEKSMLPPGTSI